MAPKQSRPERTVYSASADITPRGHRTPRGNTPRHEPRGGRQSFNKTRNPGHHDNRAPEERNRFVDDAFLAPLEAVKTNAAIFAQCISQVLRCKGAIKNEDDHEAALADEKFEAMSRHLAYLLRHSHVTHRDGSLSLHELLSHTGTARKVRSLYRDGMRSLQDYDPDEISTRFRERANAIHFMMPLAHVIVDMNKARAMVACIECKDFQPGVVPTPDSWMKLAEFGRADSREGQADYLDGLDVASIFIRFESGHSTNVAIDHCPFVPTMYPLRYLIHGTNEKNIQSIRDRGLLPGGTRGGRKHVHFVLDNELSYLKDCIRPESDCILIAKPDAVSGLKPVITHNRYVLTEERVPFDRFVGSWSFIDRAWLDVPEPDELAKMMDYGGDIDIVMHICHHQLYWDKKTQNEQDGIAWSRHDYVEYVTDEIQKLPVVQKFLSGFQDRSIAPSRPTRSGTTPNDQDLGPPEDEDDRKVTVLRSKLTARFRRHLEKAQKAEETSASETDAPKKVQPKKMPRERKDAASAASTEKDPDASDSDTGKYAEDGPRGSVRKCFYRREASTQAKRLFRDADAAAKFYDDFKKQQTDEIQWFARPQGPQCCKNFAECESADAMFWCHPCGFAFCLKCRIAGLACEHHVVNYSSEMPVEFMPDSISAANSTLNVDEVIDAVLAESSFFGATRSEHEANRETQFKELISCLRDGSAHGNTYLRSFAKYGAERFDFTGFIYSLPKGHRVPTLQEHFYDYQDETPLPIWRPEVFFDYPNDGEDLSEEEIFRLLELYRSVLLGKRAPQGVTKRTKENLGTFQRDTYQLCILTLNLGHINRVPYIGGSDKFPKWVRTDIEYRSLPHVVFRNAAHIVCLNEAHDEYGGIAAHRELCAEYGMIGMVVHPSFSSQSSIAIFLRGGHEVGSSIELLCHHQIMTENKTKPFWILHGGIFRLIHGENIAGEIVDTSTGARIPKPDSAKNRDVTVHTHDRPLATTLDFQDYSICEIDGDEKLAVNGVEVCEVNAGADGYDVRRLSLAECRVAVFHISSYAWQDAYKETCEAWLAFVSNAIEHQCDFMTGDGNLFSQRSFKSDCHSDYRTCIMLDILERFLQQINSARSPLNRITYNVVSSTAAGEYIRSMSGEDADCDSMILISLCYGKQTAVTESRAKEDSASADGYTGSAFSNEILLTDVEQYKHLIPQDFGLRETDCAWHSPLMVFTQLKALKNMRIRTQEGEAKRRERWDRRTQEYEDKREERKERRDSVPPLRRDSHRHATTQHYAERGRSRSGERARSSNPKARTPMPPPAPPVRAPSTPPKASSEQPVRYKAAPVSLKQQPTSTAAVRPPPVKAPPVAPPARSSVRTRSTSTPPDPPAAPSREPSRPPWREREHSTMPDTVYASRKRPHGIPEPPAPPRRMSGAQWLDSGGQASSSSAPSSYRNYGWENWQPSYYRYNPQTTHVEYVPGYVVPQQRWVRKYDGTWLDMIPQTPDQSIFFHQSGEIRRQNERSFYGYTFTMGL